MMLTLKTTAQFKKDYKRMKKQERISTFLKKSLTDSLAEEKLEEKHRDHALTGSYAGFRECPYPAGLVADLYR